MGLQMLFEDPSGRATVTADVNLLRFKVTLYVDGNPACSRSEVLAGLVFLGKNQGFVSSIVSGKGFKAEVKYREGPNLSIEWLERPASAG